MSEGKAADYAGEGKGAPVEFEGGGGGGGGGGGDGKAAEPGDVAGGGMARGAAMAVAPVGATAEEAQDNTAAANPGQHHPPTCRRTRSKRAKICGLNMCNNWLSEWGV